VGALMAAPVAGLSDAALRDRVAQATTLYFTDWAHPVSGMARERTGGDVGYDIHETVCTGGTGFGIMAQIVAAERGWRPARDIEDRVRRIAGYLETADRFEGVYPHFLHGTTGKALEIFPGDDGGDIVETAFLMMGLLCASQYYRASAPDLSARLVALYEGVDWTAHQRGGEIMWQRSPNRPWPANALAVRGWNEAMVLFLLACGSPTHPLPAAIHNDSWAKAEQFLNGRSFGGIPLPLGPDWGGPLFLSQYSFLGLDPRGLVGGGVDYHAHVRAHAAVNRAHCIANPKGWRGYGADLWGLTASDDPSGYVAHSPTEDTGVITPTAALGSFPFSPEASMAALRTMHDDLGGMIFGEGGFIDAFSLHNDWVAPGRLAIDQGPIAVALENHRSGLLWRLFMARPEVRRGLAAIGMTSPAV
jgi:hypothetical protein